MSIISDITIQNVKGYGNPAITLPIELKTNRVNLIFAPNGTGKSSFATAFKSLYRKSLKVSKENKYHKDETLESSLSLLLDGNLLKADAHSNTISPNLKTKVINCATAVQTRQHNMGSYTSVSGYIDIEDILIEKVVPASNSAYSVTTIRKTFGINGKILENLIEVFQDPNFLLKLKAKWNCLNIFGSALKRKKLLNDVVQYIHQLSGTTEQILHNIEERWLDDIEQNDIYLNIVEFLDDYFSGESRVQRFLRFYQLYTHWAFHKESVIAATLHVEYLKRKNSIDANLNLLDKTWKNIHTEESGGNLIVRFPHADEISNGQRDLLTFIVELIKFKIQIRTENMYLLIIDEVFDYLDDANLIAAQYYLTKFLDITKNNLFLCLLSHLNPFTFRSYAFSDKKLNVLYMQDTTPTATLPMMDFISFRERIHGEGIKGDAGKQSLYNDLSHDLFHYNPVSVDYSERIALYKKEGHLNAKWGITSALHSFLIDEVNKYLSGSKTYDPYAVALALRLRVEKIMYEMLPEHLQLDFINEKMTKNKLNYCHDHGIVVPDVLYIVSAIHNEADHLKFDVVNNRYIEKPMVYKLQNNVIKGIVKHIFGWTGIHLSTNVIG